MKRILYTLAAALVVIMVLAQCSNNGQQNSSTLDEIENVVEKEPQLGLCKVDSVENTMSGWSKRDRMRLSLIKYKAEDLCYICHNSDSTIKGILDYYLQEGADSEIREAYYYTGSTYRDMADIPKAIRFYMEATKVSNSMPTRKDSMVLFRAYSQLADMNTNIGDYKAAYLCMKQSFDIQKKLKEDDIATYEDMARVCNWCGLTDSASIFYEQSAFRIIQEKKAKKCSGYLGEQLGFYLRQQNEAMARWTMNQLSNVGKENLPANVLSSIGHYYTSIDENKDSALAYAILAAEKSTKMEAKAAREQKVAMLLASKGDTQEALRYALMSFQSSDSADAIVTREESRATYLACQAQMIEDMRRESIEKDLRRNNSIALAVICVLLVVIVFLLVLYIYNKKSRSIERRLQKTEAERDDVKERHDKLSAEVEIDRMLRKESATDIAAVVDELEKIADSQKEHLQENQWEMIFNAVDKAYPEFRSKIISANPKVKNKDLVIIYLVKLGLKQADIARLYNCARSVVSRKLHRIEQDFGMPTSEIIKDDDN